MKIDWIVAVLALVSIAFIILFVAGLDISLPLYDITRNPDGSITITGVSEVILAVCFGIAAIIKALKSE